MSIIDLNTADIFNAIGGGSPLSIIDSVLHPSYTIRNHGASTVALEFSGMASIQPSAGASIVTAPIENGKYQSINKVARPGRVVCDIVISGLTGLTGSLPNIFDLTFTSQSTTLTTIKNMLSTAATYDIDTPKDTYESYDLADYSYTVNSKRGVSLLVISLIFEEVRQQMDVSISSSQSKDKPTNNDISNSPFGVGDVTKQCSVSEAKIDGLKKSWTNLNAAISSDADKSQDKIATGFLSAMKTVNKALSDTSSSSVTTAASFVESIAKVI
ncbi:hypothetical protein LU631_02780 [Erwinia tracheiphila]|uniref:Uncharacterized protein n=1 Tax=Erwinia tracheiphila TaxID=65700 RepID=A0A0M2KI84_9GAMM|nr:hypothetical protein [Erwinia tracheiphila]EOS94773.1 hypothetical protein ETR_12003 [Erwinia tracheiphila PSU-1]KKF37022.1 hypothetical protein SY86_18840 [Erwinia tracheiphila]UIA88373.1 hypothetical protein LU631_02780 [Erwinia tracheiphila]UIA96206.1 hypothetical protein LU633_23380 [Erwinia tracheiphila]